MRRYCSRCLQTIGALDPDRCASSQCRAPRPARGWPSFHAVDDVLSERFRVREILGAGGAGITYRCFDLHSEVDVAVKVLHDDRRHGVLANRLAIEGELLELLDHPHIVPFRGLRLVGDGPLWIATGFMPGGSLEGRLRRGGPLRADTVMRLGRQLALALDFIHAQGIVHRDLKPGNVLIEVADEDELAVRLADFGIARVFRDQRPALGGYNLTRTGVFIGTPEYAAPEQIRGERGIGPAADAFALGALLHFAASQQPLLKRSEISDWEAFRKRRRDPSSRSRLVDAVAPGLVVGYRAQLEELDAIIDALLHPDAAERISMAEVALALGARPDQLANQDVLPLAPRSLVSALDDPWFDDSVDALVPAELLGDDCSEDPAPAEDTPDPGATLPNLAALPGLSQLSSLPDPSVEDQPTVLADAPVVAPSEPLSVEDVPELPVDPPIALARVPRPAVDEPSDAVPAPGADWEQDIDWPTPRRKRRNRLHAAFLALLAVGAGVALAWPGGPRALVDDGVLARVEQPVRGWIERLRTAPPTYTPSAPWKGKRVIVGEVTEKPSAPDRPAAPAGDVPERPAPAEVASQAPAPAKPLPVAASVLPSSDVPVEDPAPRSVPAPRVDDLRPVGKPAVLAKRPASAPAGAVEAWSTDPDDDREVGDVVADEAGRAHAEWLTRLAREAEDADARAARYQKTAEQDAARRAALFRAWEHQLEEAQGFVEDPSSDAGAPNEAPEEAEVNPAPEPAAEPAPQPGASLQPLHRTDRYDEIAGRWVHTDRCPREEGQVATADPR